MNILSYAQEQFKEFIKKYDVENEMIKLKIAHMIRVMNLNMKFARLQGLDNENVELAGVIGLLHDIGRFVQVEKYGTFIDSQSINHSQAGVDLLFKENFITFFVKDPKYFYIIEKAIYNHGRFEIEDGLDSITLIHCKLIRDSDKTDIFEVLLRENPDTVFDGDYDRCNTINPDLIEVFYSHRMISSCDVKTVVDDYVRKTAYIYNYYFLPALKYVMNEKYLDRMLERFLGYFKFDDINTVSTLKEITSYGNNYIKTTCERNIIDN